MDFPCDDPAGKGTVSEQLERLRKDLKKRLATKSKNMRNAFRKMATDGKIDKYKFMACMRNLDVGVGQPKLVERLFHEIDDDNSGHLTFAEFSAQPFLRRRRRCLWLRRSLSASMDRL